MNAGSGAQASGSPASEINDANEGFKLGVQVDLVVMYSSVFDEKGHFVTGLKRNSFKVYEDDKEQTIESFAQEDVPLTMGLILDLSGSIRQEIEQIKTAALAFIRASNPEDQVFLIGFNDEAELLQDFTNDVDEVRDALENTVVAGGTILYDAIYLGVQKAQSGMNPKKAIVVITDGNDRDSYYSLQELIAKVQESDVQIFCVGFLEARPEKSLFGWSHKEAKRTMNAMTRISEETGGKAYFPEAVSEIDGIVAEIARELRTQYSIAYISANTVRDGTFRRVKIRVADKQLSKLHIRHRRGYFAPKAEGPSTVGGPTDQ